MISPALVLAALVACGGTRAQLRRADALLSTGRASAAVSGYQEVLDRDPEDARALLGLARAWLAVDQPERALAPARVAASSREPGAQLVLARAQLRSGGGAQATAAARAAIEEVPDDPDAAAVMAEVLLAVGDLPAASAQAERAVQLAGGPRAMALAAWLHLRLGETARAGALATRASAGAVDDPAVVAECAAVLHYAGDRAGAKGAARTATTLLERGVTLDAWRAEVARRAEGGDTEGAVRRLAWLRVVRPDDGPTAYHLGVGWLALDVPQLALPELQAAAQMAPYFSRRGAQGVQVAPAGGGPSAEDARAQRVQLWTAIADARGRLGDARGAVQALQDIAVEEAPAWLDLSARWEAAGDPTRALEAASHAIGIAPADPAARLRVAHLLAAAGRTDEAVGHARIAWEEQPGDIDTALFLASLHRLRHEEREAQRVIWTTARLHPDDPRLQRAAAPGYTGD